MRITIQKSMFMASMLMGVIVVLALSLLWGSNYLSLSTEQAESMIENQNDSVKNTVQNIFEGGSQITKALSSNKFVAFADLDSDSKFEAENIYRDFTNAYPFIINIYGGYPSGHYIQNDFDPPPGFIITDRNWYLASKAHPEKTCFSEPYVDRVTNLTVVTASNQIIYDGKFFGVIGCDFEIKRIVDSLKNDTNYKTLSHIVVMGDSGTIALATDETLQEKNIKDYISGYNGEAVFNFAGKKCFIRSVKEELSGWIVYSFVDYDEVMKPLYTHASVIVLIGFIISSILFFIFSTILGRGFAKPIVETKDFMEKLAEGAGDLTQRIKTKAHNEVGDLVEYFNRFIESQRIMMVELKDSEKALESIGGSLSSSSQTSAASITEIMANLEGVRHQTELQTQTFTELLELLKENISKIDELDGYVVAEGRSIQDSSSAVEEMVGNISSVNDSSIKMSEQFKKLVAVANQGSTAQQLANDKVSQMVTQSEILIEANSAIAAIASQTNLLAMNAAIEAAHAGDAGKGFSVVADEIRKLSETSSSQSKTIGDELKKITVSINEVVKASKDSEKAFTDVTENVRVTDTLVQEISSAMQEQNTASHHILDSLKEMTQNSKTVQSTAEELKSDSMQIQEAVNNLSTMVETVNSSMEEIAIGTKGINESATSISEMAHETQTHIGVLEKLIGQFKT